MRQSHFLLKIITLFLISLSLFCSKKTPPPPQESILVQIGDDVSISVMEFTKRSEYTIRPPYVKNNTYIHQKMVLNSLIAEKLLALEAGEENDLVKFEPFQNFIAGRKEQAMRKWMYHTEGWQKVELDTAEVINAFRYAGREYDLDFFSVPIQEVADSIKNALTVTGKSFDQVYKEYVGGPTQIPTKKIDWQGEENPVLFETLFTDSLSKGQVIGPIEAEDGLYTTIRINGWVDKVAMSETQINQRVADVRERLHHNKANEIYSNYVAKIMSGKSVQFDQDTFFKLADLMQPVYMKTEEEKKDAFNNKFWKDKDTDAFDEEFPVHMEEILDNPLLALNGETWTVATLRDKMSRHPLVFRKQKFSPQEFPQQFKLAIVDLIRDEFITQDAYKKGYDKINIVQREENMWKHAMLSNYKRDQFLNSISDSLNFAKDYPRIIEQHLNPYIDSLQTKYSDQIKIDTDLFEKLRMTRIDMFAVDKNVPYPVIVPQFPVITTDTRLNYGSKMNE